jgi:hypothetical protein
MKERVGLRHIVLFFPFFLSGFQDSSCLELDCCLFSHDLRFLTTDDDMIVNDGTMYTCCLGRKRVCWAFCKP